MQHILSGLSDGSGLGRYPLLFSLFSLLSSFSSRSRPLSSRLAPAVATGSYAVAKGPISPNPLSTWAGALAAPAPLGTESPSIARGGKPTDPPDIWCDGSRDKHWGVSGTCSSYWQLRSSQVVPRASLALCHPPRPPDRAPAQGRWLHSGIGRVHARRLLAKRTTVATVSYQSWSIATRRVACVGNWPQRNFPRQIPSIAPGRSVRWGGSFGSSQGGVLGGLEKSVGNLWCRHVSLQ